jgi:hypothetical protein
MKCMCVCVCVCVIIRWMENICCCYWSVAYPNNPAFDCHSHFGFLRS